MPRKRPDERWILAIDDKRQELIKSIALFSGISMSEIVETSIEQYIERLQVGDYKKNLEDLKRTKNEQIKIKKMLAELARIKIEYGETMQKMGIDQLTEETRSLMP